MKWNESAVVLRGRHGLVSIFVAFAFAFAFASSVAGMGDRTAVAESESRPSIRSIERQGLELLIRASVPPGTVRVVLEGSRRNDFTGWMPKAVARVTDESAEVGFRIRLESGIEMFRVRADDSDPLPASFYTGTTNFPGEPTGNPAFTRGAIDAGVGPEAGAPGTVDTPANATPRSVVESDIWVVQGSILYFFNQLRGLQVLDLSNPDAPVLRGTFPLPGAGEQMYLVGDRHVVLLAHDPCGQWSTDAESAVIVLDVSAPAPAEVARLPLRGRIIESRLVGSALYVATETWGPTGDPEGTWVGGTDLVSFDLSNPALPVAKSKQRVGGSGNVVTATDRFLFVAVTDYSRPWPWKSELEVVDISSPDGTMNPLARIPLAGRVPDKFKIDVLGDVLRVVVEAKESNESWRFVTVLETYRLADPRAASPWSYLPLDRLELARGERLFATRFDGVRGYIVTFERIDPLWVIDLTDPADLRIAGELAIPGWSTFIRPMGDRLLTLGIDDQNGWRVAVQLFDVADPAKPALIAKVPLGEDSSWSEANQDEKAFGIFPDAGLLLVPISEWKNSGGLHGVQLLDFDRDSLAKRGLLVSDEVVPRRATVLGDRLVAVSGRELVVATVADRDRPAVSASLELAYPVERVLLAGAYRLEFQTGSLRVRALAGGDATPPEVSLGDLPVLGASVRDSRLHLLQGRPAEVQWEYASARDEWLARTNAGTLVASVWDLSALPAVSRLGETKSEVMSPWLGDHAPHWLDGELLVWASVSSGFYPWRGLTDVAVPRGGLGFWGPWWYGNAEERLVAVRISAAGVPSIVSRTIREGEGNVVGRMLSSGSLVYGCFRTFESTVVGTNTVVENAWFQTDGGWVTNIVTGSDGGSRTNVAWSADGEWRVVTNHYPVLQWWSRYQLHVTDFGSDPAAPVLRPAIPLAGPLIGASHAGALLYTIATRGSEDSKSTRTWLEASSYDGVATRLVDSVEVADTTAGEQAVATSAGEWVYLARGSWTTNTASTLSVWRLGQDGRWQKGVELGLTSPPGELQVFRDLLLSRSGSAFDLFGLNVPEKPAPLPATPPPGCFGGDLGRADGDGARGLWLPLWEYGAFRVGP